MLHLPHIHICYDVYHLVSNMNEVLDKIRRSIMKNAPYGLAQFLKGTIPTGIPNLRRKHSNAATYSMDKNVYEKQGETAHSFCERYKFKI